MVQDTINRHKRCPRCGAAFVCHHEEPSICQCAGVTLSLGARAYLRKHYSDCLCRKCLEEIGSMFQKN